MQKVSVIIPAYNKADYTVKTIESVLSQTYKPIEIIVVDDGSTDNTRQLLSQYSNSITYIHKENGGACSARNLGIKASTGAYIALLDCDDIYLPNKIELSVDYLNRNAQCGFVYTPVYFIDDKDNILRVYPSGNNLCDGHINSRLLIKNFIPNSTVVVRKACFWKVGFFDESIFTPADWDMWLRLSENYKAGYIKLPLTKYRISSNYILNNLEQSEKENLAVLKKAFHRNYNISNRLRDKALSSVYLSSGLNYLLKNEFDYAKNRFILAIKNNVFNFHALLLFIYFLASKKSLQYRLTKRFFNKDALGS